MRKPVTVLICLLFMTVLIRDPAHSEQSDVAQIVGEIQKVYSRSCCFRAAFDQLTVNVAMDLKDRFRGTMYVRRPSHIALEVQWPEKQRVVLSGRSYTVYFPADGNAVRGEVPPEMNVEHFFGFFANMGDLDRKFSIRLAAPKREASEKLVFLELTGQEQPQSTYRIILGVDRTDFTVKRAIIYDALGNYNRFDLSNITFLTSLPGSLFKISPGPMDILYPSRNRSTKDSEKK